MEIPTVSEIRDLAELINKANVEMHDAARRDLHGREHHDRLDELNALKARLYRPIEDALRRTRSNETGAIEPLIRFLEADPYCFGSGYMKAQIIKVLTRVELGELARERLRAVVFDVVNSWHRREFRSYVRLARAVGDDAMRQTLADIATNAHTDAAIRASWMLDAISERPTGGTYDRAGIGRLYVLMNRRVEADAAQRSWPHQIVAAGYNSLGSDYLDWSRRVTDPAREAFVAELEARLPDGAGVLELGCGPGVPTTRRLAERFTLTAVDVSEAQLEMARANVPSATFIHADMASLDFPADSFDAVVALYSIIHVPRYTQPALFKRIARWLRPGGYLLATLSAGDSPHWTGEWIEGRQMFFSGFDAATNRRLIAESGFVAVLDEEVEIEEPEGPARFLWILARRAS
jgi:SAM-dependent methyltransferase